LDKEQITVANSSSLTTVLYYVLPCSSYLIPRFQWKQSNSGQEQLFLLQPFALFNH